LIAERLSEEEVHNLREAFKIVDNEKSERDTYKAFLEDSTPILTTWISIDCHNAWIPSYNRSDSLNISHQSFDFIEAFSQNRKRDGGYFNADGNFV
ncbi:unnamed protein product, partial [Brassica oleracea var. botrytis]